MTAEPDPTAHANYLWGHTTARGLADLGVDVVFFSPGSRSTPLVLGCESEPRLSCVPVLDERTAAFLALGQSKRTGRPAALICTSGSAPSHWYPAVTEASYSGIPLLLLSADRPPELQECGAGQTINQVHLFGTFVRGFHAVPLPATDPVSLHSLQSVLQQAYSQSTSNRPGPVHLNFPFREPLWPESNPPPALPQLSSLPTLANSLVDPEDNKPPGKLPHARFPVLIAGLDCPSNLPSNLDYIPILCDSLSPFRESGHPARILRYEHLLRCPEFVQSIRPDLFILLGPLPTSKTLRSWIEQSGAARVVIEPSGRKVDPLEGPSRPLTLNYDEMSKLKLGAPDPTWLSVWTQAERTVESSLHTELARLPISAEPKITRVLSEHLPARSLLYCANSMPIRDLEWFWKPGNLGRRLFGARGVNGIDGTLGTALGLAHLSEQPTYLLCGDLAFLHDSNALLFLSHLIGSLTVILINNQGGGIFEHLPVAQLSEFEKCFSTPQNCDFKKLCEAHALEHLLCENEKDLISFLHNPPVQGMRVIEIRTDRKADRDTRRHLLALSPNT